MNARALLSLGPTDDLTITTTFEPCSMCASTIVQGHIPHVRYAAADPLFDGMHDWFADVPLTRPPRWCGGADGDVVDEQSHPLRVVVPPPCAAFGGLLVWGRSASRALLRCAPHPCAPNAGLVRSTSGYRVAMAKNCVTTSLKPEDVFVHLLDPWRYPEWLLGASTMRDVDDSWPEVGSSFHHRVGFGPLKVNDRSKVLEIEPPTRLVLHVRATPALQAIVTFTVEPTSEGSILWLEEHPALKLGQLLRPILDPPTHVRNKASLRNLADLMHRDQQKAESNTEAKAKAAVKGKSKPKRQ